MSGSITRDVINLTIGAGIGAGTMFLLDPDEGVRRRKRIAKTARQTVRRTGDTLSSGWETIRGRAHDVGERASESVKGLSGTFRHAGERISEMGGGVGQGLKRLSGRIGGRQLGWPISRLGKRAGEIRESVKERASDLSEYATGVGQDIAGRAGGATERLRELAGRRERRFGLTSGLVAVGCLTIGVGAMYLLNPADGMRRRAVLRDKFLSGFGRMAHKAEGLGKNAWNRLRGTAHEMRSAAARRELPDDVLVQRVRSRLGRCVSNPQQIQVRARGGSITLSGPVLTTESDSLLRYVWAIRGVRELINQLDITQRPESLQRTTPQTAEATRE